MAATGVERGTRRIPRTSDAQRSPCRAVQGTQTTTANSARPRSTPWNACETWFQSSLRAKTNTQAPTRTQTATRSKTSSRSRVMLRESSHRSLTCGCSPLDRATGAVAWGAGCGLVPEAACGVAAGGGTATGRCGITLPKPVGGGLDCGRAWTEGCGAPYHV